MRPLSRHSLYRASALLALAPATLAAQTAVREAARENASGVPRGMMPPAGKCRVWVEGIPATRQPAPTDCATALRQKPANARVIYGPSTPEQRAVRLDTARRALPQTARPAPPPRQPATGKNAEPATVRTTPPAPAPKPAAAQAPAKPPTEPRKKPEQP